MPRKWILAVDDDPAMLALLDHKLAGENHVVTTASDTRQAFLQARDLRPALVVCDLQMPGHGFGVDALNELRKDPRLAGIPFLFLTGLSPDQARKIVPADDPLVRLFFKPPDWAALRAAIKELSGLEIGSDAA